MTLKTRLLIVDDDEAFAYSVRRYLGMHDFDCLIALNGDEALSMMRSNSFDVLMVDIRMPQMDGFEVCRRIRERSNAPLIMCSGAASDADKRLALDLGADDCVVKPIDARTLIARVNALLRRARNDFDIPDRIQIGKLVLDEPTRSGLFDDRDLMLTVHEFELLWLLGRAKGRPMKRESILESIQGADEAFDRSVDVHVFKIRRKLRDDGKKYLRTVRGLGYVLAVPNPEVEAISAIEDIDLPPDEYDQGRS